MELSPGAAALFNAKRFAIAAYLYARGRVTMAELREATGLSWGDLDSNLRYLRRRGLVEARKALTREGPRTLVWLTREGERAFEELVSYLEQRIHSIPRRPGRES